MTSSSATATAASAQKILNPLLIRRLYRSILKTSKPFTSSLQNVSPDASDTATISTTSLEDTSSSTTKIASLRTPIVMNCLLHRTGYDDESWMDFLRGFTTTISTTTATTTTATTSNNRNNTASMIELLSREEREQTLFRILLREVLCGGGNGGTLPPLSDNEQNADPNLLRKQQQSLSSLGLKIMQLPIHVRQNPNRIHHIIRREFRIPIEHHIFDSTTRQNMAFRCIREMNKKLVYAYNCEQKFYTPPPIYSKKKQPVPTLTKSSPPTSIPSSTTHDKVANTNEVSHPNPFYYQMAKDVRPLPLVPSSSYLRPGLFLLAHPNMTGYFRRSVICILVHRTGEEDGLDDDGDDDDHDDDENDIQKAAAASDDTIEEEEEDDYDEDEDEHDDDDREDENDFNDDSDDEYTTVFASEEGADMIANLSVHNDFVNDTLESIGAPTGDSESASDEKDTTTTTIHLQEQREQTDGQQPVGEDQQPKQTKSKSSRKKHRKKQQQYGTYGLIVNRLSLSPYSGKAFRMNDVLRPLPSTIMKTFGKYPIREGGPVHMSVQMLYQINTSIANSLATPTSSSSTDDSSEGSNTTNHHNIGGYILPTIQPDIVTTDDKDDSTNDISTAIGSCDTDKAVYYRGNIMNLIKAMESGIVENGEDDISFFVGASCWSVGQLEREIEHGFWLPCIGPTSIAQTGMCDYYNTSPNATTTPSPTIINNEETQSSPQFHHHQQPQQNHPRPEADLWLSMMSACGVEEAKLAHLLYKDDGKDKNGAACDSTNTSTNSSS